ncbi:MAG TPA: hypothetical protein ENH46_02915 [Candidatus Pacearchaeota archaeon]|nr:hypothetical protein [Candidatus Pacearchaeota archaeon]
MKLSYWKRYDRVYKNFSAKKIYNKILDFAKKLGKPFEKKSNRGRNFSIEPEEYVAYSVFKISSGDHLRDMELDTESFFKKHLDHSTFGKNLKKIPCEYLRKLLQLTGKYLEKLLGHTKVHIPDSTKLSADRYKEIIYRGEPRLVKETFKLHTLVQRHPKKKMTIIMDGLSSDAHISDAEGAVRMSHVLQEGDILPADRGYDYEKVYEACAEKKVITNIKKQDRQDGKGFRYRKKAKFRTQSYKKQRGVVETRFGTIENAGLTLTHYRNEDTRFKYGLILLMKQNIDNLLRLEVEKLIILVNCSTNSSSPQGLKIITNKTKITTTIPIQIKYFPLILFL